ncbi:hypothetical protein CASFOL_019818 [Castilleja foliolosa]|uniref:RING-type domain-containing protein n=1 Tax=Castilleja foliolosa TaxID=1961234 RepID=A0ABD3CZ33_9LAMI
MAKSTSDKRNIAQPSRLTPYSLTPQNETEGMLRSDGPKTSDWEDATCSVCMECPHNAVLLLCSSHDKGCRPYMCGTSFRYSNCLDQYNKAYSSGLTCPLCRSQVKGWTVVEPAREHLNTKRRNCMHDDCSFVGTYKELRKHVRADHPSCRPREVDPAMEQKWRGMERERETEDVRSMIRSSTPGAVFFGDYVIEGGRNGNYSEDEVVFDWDGIVRRDEEGMRVTDGSVMSVFRLLQAFRSGGGVRPNEDDDAGGNDDGYDMSLVSRLRRQGRLASGRRRRR